MKAAMLTRLAAAAIAFASVSFAADTTGPNLPALQATDPSLSVQALYTQCTASDTHQQMYCAGFFAATVDSMMVLGSDVSTQPLGICSKTAITTGAAVQAFKNWAQKHPEAWGLLRFIGVTWAMQEVWPCVTHK